MVVTITRDGFIKRTTLETFRAQNRGGRGRTGAGTRGDDIVTRSFNAHTHQWVLFFSSGGKAFREKVWRLPEAGPTAKGRALVNLLPELGADTITTVLPLPQDETLWDSLHLVFATASGNVRRNRLSDFRNVRAAGLIAMKLDEGDRLIGVATCREGDDVLLATRRGRCIRFQITDDTLRVFAGRDSSGVRGIRLAERRRGDQPVGAAPCRCQHRGTRRLSEVRQRASRRGNGDEEDAEPSRRPSRGSRSPTCTLTDAAHRRAGGRGRIPADRHRWRLRQAHLGLRVPGHRPRRPGDRQHHAGAAQWHRGRRHLPGAAGRRRDAGDRCRAADPGAGRPGADHRPPGDGRDAVPPGRRRARDQRVPGDRR